MIGILCSNQIEKEFTEKFNNFYKKYRSENDEAVIIFTILNIDFIKKTVNGSLVSGKTITTVQVSIPSVIFNFGSQRRVDCIKARKLLEDMEEVELINNVNRFDQNMIMDILSASEATSKYLLPYYTGNSDAAEFIPDEDKSYIDMPVKGTCISRILYKKKHDYISEDENDIRYFKKGHICELIDTSLCTKKRIFLEIPGILINNNPPTIVRNYAQRISNNSWEIIGEHIYGENELINADMLKKTRDATLACIAHIRNYLPSLGEGFIDLIINADGNPYFLHLGGISGKFFELKQEDEFYMEFYKNLIKLANYLNYM